MTTVSGLMKKLGSTQNLLLILTPRHVVLLDIASHVCFVIGLSALDSCKEGPVFQSLLVREGQT